MLLFSHFFFFISCEGIVNDECNGKFLCFGLIRGKTKGVWRIFVTKGINSFMILYAAELHRDCVVGSMAGNREEWCLQRHCFIECIGRKKKKKLGHAGFVSFYLNTKICVRNSVPS